MASLPGCTSEGCNYVIECLPCRKQGKRRRYYGETSRSPHQRGNEHLREIIEQVATHPLVVHFEEEHSGERQEILMRVLSKHATPLDRQVRESLNITTASATPDECLNIKSEWGGSKLPTLMVASAKGTARKQGSMNTQETAGKGDKRIRIREEREKEKDSSESRPGKRSRQRSPEPGGSNWKMKVSFKVVAPGNAGQDICKKVTENKVDEQTGENLIKSPLSRTPVREKAGKINQRTSESPGKFPGKQQKIVQYFGRKSPKAAKAKETIGKKKDEIPKAENSNKNQGATDSSPLLGDASYPGCQKIPKRPQAQVLWKVGDLGEARWTEKLRRF